MLSDNNFEELETNGYTVVSNVISDTDCDNAIAHFTRWVKKFETWPKSSYSLITKYATGHLEPSWHIRLKTKPVFSELWKTEKLLSSFDAIAIGRPPEDGEEPFRGPDFHWLHLDQNPSRVGLHAYQGAVYLEEACEDDWTLQVMEGSHKHFVQYFDERSEAAMRCDRNIFYKIGDEGVAFYKDKGCEIKRIPVPKGGMVLWDSRLVHANACPIEGRKHPGRWRYTTFVCMTPASWASPDDLKKKRQAYDDILNTTHWASQGITFLPRWPDEVPHVRKKLPENARTKEAKLLSGVEMYNFDDGQPTGADRKPVWKDKPPV